MDLLPSELPRNPRIERILSDLRENVLNELGDRRKDGSSAAVLRIYFNKAFFELGEVLAEGEDLRHIGRLLVLAHFAAKSRLQAELEAWVVGARHEGYLKYESYLQEVEVLALWSMR